MNYIEAKAWIQNQRKLTADTISEHKDDFTLDGIKKLLERLSRPQDSLSFVHVVGTNGKGSFIAYLESILVQSNIHVGMFSSPYLVDEKEMMRIDGKEIDESTFAQLVTQVAQVAETMEPVVTEYECLTAIALLYFSSQRCQIVLWESALGSKDDVTNVIDVPLLTVCMHMGMDHMDVMGDTIEKITRCELEILKEGTVCLSALQEQKVMPIIQQECQKRHIPLIETQPITEPFVSYKEITEIQHPSLSHTQHQNSATAIEAALFLQDQFPTITHKSISLGITKAYWPGRFEVLQESPFVLLDGGHNMDCLDTLLSDLKRVFGNQEYDWIVGMYKDKEVQTMMEKIEKHAHTVFCVETPSKRCMPSIQLARFLKEKAGVATSFEKAISQIQKPTIIFGSLSLIPLAHRYFLDTE